MQRKWESGRALFILSILFNVIKITDIMGDLTDGMRDLTGVINSGMRPGLEENI